MSDYLEEPKWSTAGLILMGMALAATIFKLLEWWYGR